MKTEIVCLEGITGAGKTVQALRIAKYLEESRKSYQVINEKQYEPFRQVIIDWHNAGANSNFTQEMIMGIARARGEAHKLHFNHLINYLDYLIFDRSFYTSAIYQSDGELSKEQIIQLNIREGAIKPQEGLIILCSPEIAMQRIEERRLRNNNYNLPSMHETLEEITKRRELYIALARRHSELYLIDTTDKTEDEVFEEVRLRLRL